MTLLKPCLITLCILASSLLAEDLPVIFYPDKIDEDSFSPLLEASPFQRTINVEDTYSLRAVVTYDDDIAYARVYNNKTKKTITIELNGEPQHGLKLIKVIKPRGQDLSLVSAEISFAGEVAELKYDSSMIDPANRQPPSSSGRSKGGKGGKGDKGGGRRGPSPEDRDTYRSLSEAQRSKLHNYMRAQRSNSDLPFEQRMLNVRKAMKTLANGGDIKIPGN